MAQKMTTWSKVHEQLRPAPRVVPLPPACFADGWHKKPDAPIDCGLRLVSEGDIERARIAALEYAQAAAPEPGDVRIDTFNDAIMRMVLAQAMCMPDNCRENFFDLPEEDAKAALTDDAVKFLWHEYDVLKTSECNYIKEASDDDLADLAALLFDESAWEKLSKAEYKRLRRLAYHMLEELDPDPRFD